MRSQSLTAFVALISAAAATNSFHDAPPFSCPSNTDNHCSSSQSGGFNWAGLTPGKGFDNFGGFDFSRWSCASSFKGSKKRDLLTGRTFQDKCITGKASNDANSCPSFSCASSQDVQTFSVSTIQISVEFDCDIEFHYGMPGGSVCKQTSSCSSQGTTVKNTQCGGAHNVTVVYPGGGKGNGKSTCDIGVHQIGFDCNPQSPTKPPHSPPPPSTKPNTPRPPTTYPVSPAPTTTPAGTSSTISPSSSPANIPTYPIGNTTSVATTPPTSAQGTTTAETTPLTSAQGTTTAPEDVITTVIVDTTTTVCPVTMTHTSGGTTSIETGVTTSTILITSTHTTCNKCAHQTTPPSPTSSPEGAVTSPSSPAPTAPAPEILPQCLNTWMFSAGCSSNTDAACYCTVSDFVCNVFDCLSAHGATDDDIASAQTYLQGICAPYLNSNPAIITCAASVTPTGTAAGTIPVTTIQVLTTVVVPCSESGTLIPSSSTTSVLSTAITVPQVVFETTTGSTTAAAQLVVGTPAPASAPAGVITAPSTPAATTFASVPVANGTSTPFVPASSSSHSSFTFGTLAAAIMFSIFVI